jgi:hypothetical protein
MWKHGQQVQVNVNGAVLTCVYIDFTLGASETFVVFARFDPSQLYFPVPRGRTRYYALCIKKDGTASVCTCDFKEKAYLPICTFLEQDMDNLFGKTLPRVMGNVTFTAYGQSRAATLEFLLLCKHELPIHRNIAQVIAHIVYNSYADSIWIK